MLNTPTKFKAFLWVAGLIALNVFAWQNVLSGGGPHPGFYFLNVGQGDSELAVFSNGAKVLTDAGPGRGALDALGQTLGTTDNYVDLAVITHPELDHYGGFAALLDRYDFGAFIWTGREPQVMSREWTNLRNKIKEKNIPMIVLGAKDKIILGGDKIEILSPDSKLVSAKATNESGIVEKISIGESSALFTADIGKKTENYLMDLGLELSADILKVGHHGSKYSSGADFLNAVSPTLAAIEVGKNSYGHPTKEALGELENSGAVALRTDLQGTFSAWKEGNSLIISTKTKP